MRAVCGPFRRYPLSSSRATSASRFSISRSSSCAEFFRRSNAENTCPVCKNGSAATVWPVVTLIASCCDSSPDKRWQYARFSSQLTNGFDQGVEVRLQIGSVHRDTPPRGFFLYNFPNSPVPEQSGPMLLRACRREPGPTPGLPPVRQLFGESNQEKSG